VCSSSYLNLSMGFTILALMESGLQFSIFSCWLLFFRMQMVLEVFASVGYLRKVSVSW